MSPIFHNEYVTEKKNVEYGSYFPPRNCGCVCAQTRQYEMGGRAGNKEAVRLGAIGRKEMEGGNGGVQVIAGCRGRMGSKK